MPTACTEQRRSVVQLAARYLRWAGKTYRKGGKPTSHVGNIRYALRDLDEQAGGRAADDYAAPDLASLRDRLALERLAVATINKRLSIIQTAFAWGRQYGLCAAATVADLAVVTPLRPGRSPAKDPVPVLPVDRQVVEATQRHLPPVLVDLIELLWIQGCRPQEICNLCPAELEIPGAEAGAGGAG
ncbi:MAG TPA: hypothetical protein VK797_23565, partial [Tepidisphaeraceae bacterium]|nr:hypothetical protein [Tepidisphaeraceae bacterium]